MQTEDKSAQIILLRTLGSVLVLMALGMTAARILGWLDVSGLVIASLLTVAIANWTIAHAISNKEDEFE